MAVLIADSFGYPFEEIREIVQPLIWRFPGHPDLYYMRGKNPNVLQKRLNTFSDTQRYSKFWPIQRSFDQVQLGLSSKFPKHIEPHTNHLEIDISEGLRYLGLKFFTALKYLYEMKYDIVYKTTLSSIVIGDNFKRQTDSIDLSSPFYGGTPINFGRHPFASGANLMLNRKAIAELIILQKRWNHGLLDDVAIGRLLENSVSITEISSLSISSLTELEHLSDDELHSMTHFRCKSSLPIRNDVEIMLSLYERLSK